MARVERFDVEQELASGPGAAASGAAANAEYVFDLVRRIDYLGAEYALLVDQIESATAVVIAKSGELDVLQSDMKATEAQVDVDIYAAVDADTKKPMYSNEMARKAARVEHLAVNEEYQAQVVQEREIKRTVELARAAQAADEHRCRRCQSMIGALTGVIGAVAPMVTAGGGLTATVSFGSSKQGT